MLKVPVGRHINANQVTPKFLQFFHFPLSDSFAGLFGLPFEDCGRDYDRDADLAPYLFIGTRVVFCPANLSRKPTVFFSISLFLFGEEEAETNGFITAVVR